MRTYPNCRARLALSIAYMDREIESLLAALDERGVLENTVVGVTSDHGEQFGEHGVFDHGNTLFAQVLHVPLLVVYPRSVPAGITVSEPVTLRDVPATILDLAGRGNTGTLPGRTLARFWTPDPAEPPSLVEESPILSFVSKGIRRSPFVDIHSLVQDGYHFIRYADGRQRLFDIRSDIEEEHDLAGSAEHVEVLERMGRALEKQIRGSVDAGERASAPEGLEGEPRAPPDLAGPRITGARRKVPVEQTPFRESIP